MSGGASRLNKSEYGQIVVFLLDEQEFGIGINAVKEIVRPQDTTRIPLVPDYFVGLMNLRGGILPVIDTRRRIGVKASEFTDRTRFIVINLHNYVTGLVVDEVREVLSLDSAIVEPPPSLTISMENFVPRVAKFDNGRRIVFLLDHEQVLEYGVDLGRDNEGGHYSSAFIETSLDADASSGLARFITFTLGDELYAFSIEKISEIIRFTEAHSVPEAAPHIKGLLSLRGAVVPIFDLRLLMGLKPLCDERIAELSRIKQFFYKRLSEARKCAECSRVFERCPDGKCKLDDWLMARVETCRSETELNIVQKLLHLHHSFHEKAPALMDKSSFIKEIDRTKQEADVLFAEYERSLEKCIKEEQRIFILRHENRPYGLLIDKVEEVQSVLDDELERSHDFSDDIWAIAKIDKGKKLMFILNDLKIVPFEDIEELSQEEECDMEQASDAMKLDEIQLVTFTIGDEEYGIPIVSVQEINRLQEITRVPRSPSFIEGVTNLRGEVIPMVDLRKRFNIGEKERDDRTRLVIVNINGKKTGFIVDRVNEVTRIPKRNIEKPPPLLSSQIDLNFVDGLAKTGKDRMIIVLNAQKVLSEEEVKELDGIVNADGNSSSSADNKTPDLEIME